MFQKEGSAMKTKKCSMCKKEKSLDDFHKKTATRKDSRCKKCKSDYHKENYARPEVKKRHQEYRAEHSAEIKGYKQEWWIKNKGRKIEEYREYRLNNPYKVKNRELMRHYGITIEQFLEMYEEQGGKCYMCKISEAVAVDHNHATGAVRKLLCIKCNFAVGWVEKHARPVLAYLKEVEGEPFSLTD